MAKKPTKARKARKGPRKARKATKARKGPRKATKARKSTKANAGALLTRAHAAIMRAIPLVDDRHRDDLMQIEHAIEHARNAARKRRSAP
jgi:hypothetical protein